VNESIETGKRHRMKSSRSRSEGKGSFEGIKRQMEAQLAMKKRGSKERTYLTHTCVGGAAAWMETNVMKKENNQNGRVTKGQMKRHQN